MAFDLLAELVRHHNRPPRIPGAVDPVTLDPNWPAGWGGTGLDLFWAPPESERELERSKLCLAAFADHTGKEEGTPHD